MALTMTPVDERTILETIGKSKPANTFNVNFSGLLDACEKAEASTCLKNGGKLFEAFIIRVGKQKDSLLLRRHLEHNIPMHADIQNFFVKKYTIQFWFYFVTSMQRVSRFIGSLLFIWTMCLEFYGLSRFGMQLLSHAKVGQDIRTYDRWRLEYLSKYDAKVATMIARNDGILVYDNYNHQYGNPKLDLDRKNKW